MRNIEKKFGLCNAGIGKFSAQSVSQKSLRPFCGEILPQHVHQFGDGRFGGDVVAADDAGLLQLPAGFVELHGDPAAAALRHVHDEQAPCDGFAHGADEFRCRGGVAGAVGFQHYGPQPFDREHGAEHLFAQTGKKADGTPAVQMVEMLFIPEGDVYRLIAHSKLPSAERFERWVFDEVLPSIRQHGAYITRDKLWEVATSPEALLKLCTDLLAEREKNAALREDNARLQSKAVYYDLFIDLRHSTNLRTTAKELDVPERRFVRFLLERRFVYRTPSGCVLPYAKSANDGLFCVRDYYRNGHTGSYTLVTPKGKLHFAELRSLILVTV